MQILTLRQLARTELGFSGTLNGSATFTLRRILPMQEYMYMRRLNKYKKYRK